MGDDYEIDFDDILSGEQQRCPQCGNMSPVYDMGSGLKIMACPMCTTMGRVQDGKVAVGAFPKLTFTTEREKARAVAEDFQARRDEVFEGIQEAEKAIAQKRPNVECPTCMGRAKFYNPGEKNEYIYCDNCGYLKYTTDPGDGVFSDDRPKASNSTQVICPECMDSDAWDYTYAKGKKYLCCRTCGYAAADERLAYRRKQRLGEIGSRPGPRGQEKVEPFTFNIKKEDVVIVPEKPKGYAPCPQCGKRGFRTTDKGDGKLCAYCNYFESKESRSLTFEEVGRYVEACRTALLTGDVGALRIIADNVERDIRGEVLANSSEKKLSDWEIRLKRIREDAA